MQNVAGGGLLEQALKGVAFRLRLCHLFSSFLLHQFALGLKVLQHLLQAGLQSRYLVLALLFLSCLCHTVMCGPIMVNIAYVG